MEEIHNFTISADVQFNEEGTEVTASRLFLQTKRIEDSQEELKMLLSLRELAASLPFKVILFHPLFFIFDQFAEVFNLLRDKLGRDLDDRPDHGDRVLSGLLRPHLLPLPLS